MSPKRLISEKGVDSVDEGMKERELSLEKEYQRVSISGEEKCGVRSFFLDVYISGLNLNSSNSHSFHPPLY